MPSWLDDERLTAGNATFWVMPPDPKSRAEFMDPGRRAAQNGDFFVAKPRWVIESYLELFARLQPERIFELGVYSGGSTALFAEISRPQRLVAIDNQRRKLAHVRDFVAERDLASGVRIYEDVDQADAFRLAKIADAEFGGNGIDLVVDDCSHQYGATRSSFNVLFPRLRPGGIFVIEDWPWAHAPLGHPDKEGIFPGELPLTRLIFELVLAIPGVPDLITDITINRNLVSVTRGTATVEPSRFDIAECSNRRGRELLSPTGSA
jgi:SAM-dependent methyltransferase